MKFRRDRLTFHGIVQGVGFRPAIARLAGACGVAGRVWNAAGQVVVEAEGRAAVLDEFRRLLPASLPAGAQIERLDAVSAEADGVPAARFVIAPSRKTGRPQLVVPADLALCPACRAEIADPAGRRYGYAFNSCADCGPRYTFIEALPYDRAATAMRDFPLCPACRAEYEDPADRRFHVEGIGCPVCGPRLRLLDAAGRERPGDPLALAAAALRSGRIVAFQSIGGFQLLADAGNPAALAELRKRKDRPHQPLALMVRDEAAALAIGAFDAAGRELLTSPAAPVVIVERRGDMLPWPLIAPDVDRIGVMLAYTPLHVLLFAAGAPDFLVATSGNRHGSPIAADVNTALAELGSIADCFLCCDRRIVRRNDDSVAVAADGPPQLWRRARGFAPSVFRWQLPETAGGPARVAAFGAELKNAIALADRDGAAVSPHVGDLSDGDAADYLVETFDSLCAFLGFRPDAAAVDLHPDLAATRCGEAAAAKAGIPVIRVQHHHAHAAALLAEHGLDRALALIFDGTGFGDDGTIWGAELFDADFSGYRRLASFTPSPLPGGDLAVLEPVRQLAARHFAAGATTAAVAASTGVAPETVAIWRRQCETNLNAPRSRSAGRLFDAFAALLGLAPGRITYEAQAAIRLETAAGKIAVGATFRMLPEQPFRIVENHGLIELDWTPLFADPDRYRAADAGLAAAEFHAAMVRAAVAMLDFAPAAAGPEVVIGGGVLQNRRFAAELTAALLRRGRRVFAAAALPPNDGAIAFGQAAVALGRTL